MYVKLCESYRLRTLYKPGMSQLLLLLYQFDMVLRAQLPLLADHFESNGIQSNMCAPVCNGGTDGAGMRPSGS